ncbi:CD63 antigen-like isoform X3 [Orbicella faveolata]|nr:CD63 antigen-like isoform X3 [Orbicella faveolata]
MLGVAIWVTTQDTEYKHLAGNLYVTIGYIVLSSFVFIIGFMGACGILLLKKTLLRVYFGLMLLLLLMELGVAIYLYIEKDKISDHITANWNQTSDEARIIIQKEFECCGLKPLNLEHKSSSDKSCFVDNDTTKERLKDCYTHLMDWIKANHIILATCSAIVAALQLLILGGTCRLISEIESGDRFVNRTRVVPFNVHQNAQHLPQVQQANPGSNPHPNPQKAATVTAAAAALTAASSSKAQRNNANDDSEDGSRKSTARKNWAKVNPKYNAVFSLLD